MKLGDKPLADMSETEMLEAVAILRAKREALRSEAIVRKQEREKGNIVKEPKRVVKKEMDSFLSDTLAFLKEDQA
jgi:hypothetical protein